MPLCLASWPSSSRAQALQQPHAEQPDSPDPQPQILVDEEKIRKNDFRLSSCQINIFDSTTTCVCVFLPSWYSVWPTTADTAGTIASAVSTHCADHALVQLPLVHAWLAHHTLLFLLLQLILQVFIHGCGHALHTKRYTEHTHQQVRQENERTTESIYICVRYNILCIVMCNCFLHVLTFPCLAHSSSVSATLALVVHTKCPHFPTLGQDTRMGFSHGDLSYKVTFQVCHLACGAERVGFKQRDIYRQINCFPVFLKQYSSEKLPES